MRIVIIFIFCILSFFSNSQTYFPPNNSSNWDTIPSTDFNWCQEKIDSLYSFLDATNSKSFILLKNGKIVLEQYFNGHTDTSFWYWASAGKTLMSCLVGIAQEDGYLKISDTTSNYLGSGWTSCNSLEEEKITIWNQLTMTSGLDDLVPNPFCTDDTCLTCVVDPGNRWRYHNAPYTLLRPVLENATGQGLNLFSIQNILNPIGMDGFFVYNGYDNLFSSTSRSMARFGLFIQNQGNWNGNQIMNDTNYFNQMISSSQTLNNSYGYLWWLNGKTSYMLPGLPSVFFGNLFPNAPNDLIAALGKNGQIINIVPSQDLVLIRMGQSPDSSLVPMNFVNELWDYLNDLPCNVTNINQEVNKYSKELDKVIDFLGRETSKKNNIPLIYMYKNGTVEKKIFID